MANSVDLEQLCQGAKAWNTWRAKHPDIVPDLSDANLTLSQRQFGPASGGPINLRGVNLSGATLRYATLSGADLEDANLSGADLVHARLDGANLTGADLTDAVCDNADLAHAKLDEAVLTGTSFGNARNLTEDQIAFAHGDATTLLPAAMMPPSSWFPGMEDSSYPEYPVPEQMVDEDLYEMLGVSRTAKAEDIRASFRNLVKKLHPDVNPDDEDAQESFKKVSIAYRILNDPEKRARYDKGEIGTDGEINPEFEAKRQFRRYAFRFYTAAAMSLLLAAGVLGVVWHAVLTDEPSGRGRVEIAVATPPKSSERLGATHTGDSELKVDFRRQPEPGSPESAADADAAKTELFAQPPLANDQPVPPTGDAKAVPKEQAQAEPAKGDREKADTPALNVSGKQASLETGVANADLPEKRAGEAAPQAGAEKPASGSDSAGSTANPAPVPNTESAATPPAQVQAALAPPQQNGGSAVEPAPSPGAAPAGAADGQNSPPPGATPPPSTADAPPAGAVQSEPPQEAKVTTRPLFEQNKEEQAGPAQADAARADAPSQQANAADLPGIPYAQRISPPRSEAVVWGAEGRKNGRDAISALFRQRALKQALAQDQPQATASMGPLASRNGFDAQDEVLDIYTHSIPDAGAPAAGAWPGFAEGQKNTLREMRQTPRDVTAKIPARENHSAPASRKQAVSDILAGGL